MNKERSSSKERPGTEQTSPDGRKGWGIIAVGVGFAITLLLTIAVMVYIFLNTKGFE